MPSPIPNLEVLPYMNFEKKVNKGFGLKLNRELLRRILRSIAIADNELYEQIEKYTSYPDNDDFDKGEEYDMAVDNAEVEALMELVFENAENN